MTELDPFHDLINTVIGDQINDKSTGKGVNAFGE